MEWCLLELYCVHTSQICASSLPVRSGPALSTLFSFTLHTRYTGFLSIPYVCCGGIKIATNSLAFSHGEMGSMFPLLKVALQLLWLREYSRSNMVLVSGLGLKEPGPSTSCLLEYSLWDPEIAMYIVQLLCNCHVGVTTCRPMVSAKSSF